LLRPQGRKLFHGSRGWHRSGAIPVTLQLLLAGAILGFLIAGRPPSAGAPALPGGANRVEVPDGSGSVDAKGDGAVEIGDPERT
jgi:hypothetical protein